MTALELKNNISELINKIEDKTILKEVQTIVYNFVKEEKLTFHNVFLYSIFLRQSQAINFLTTKYFSHQSLYC